MKISAKTGVRMMAALLAAAMGAATCNAQATANAVTNYQRTAAAVVSSFQSALAAASQSGTAIDGEGQTALSPYLFPLTSAGVYYSAAVADKLALGKPGDSGSPTAPAASTPGIDYRDAVCAEVSSLLANAYTGSPHLISYSEQQIAAEEVVNAATATPAKTEDLDPIIESATQIGDVADVVGDVAVELEVDKPNFWSRSGSFSLQFTQNYFSENWYKGGNNNVTMLSNLVLEANYNDQRKIQWDNKLDLRMGFVSTTSDQYHKFLTSNDKIALYSKLGVKAAKYWNYAASLDATTQFMPGYKSNNPDKFSNFLSPLDVFISIGMDFKPQLKNGNSLSVALLPLSYKMRYIHAEEETIHKAYNMVDRDFTKDYGSKVECNAKMKLLPDLSWRCRFYYFTSYEYAESELENALSFQFNKYISSEVYTLWRFDDNRAPSFKDSTLGYFQFKEYFTLGLSYKF